LVPVQKKQSGLLEPSIPEDSQLFRDGETQHPTPQG